MTSKIFYSWQSDLPNATNRGFIEDCIERAVKELHREAALTVEPVVDRDTAGVEGTPDISATILSKIDAAKIFVGDVSIINEGTPGRQTPNPNVLVELGYAVGRMGWENVLCVANTAYGDKGRLPFDIRGRRLIFYSLKEGAAKAGPREGLVSQLKTQILAIEDAGLPRLKRDILALLKEVNPETVRLMRSGQRTLSVNLTARHQDQLFAIAARPGFDHLVSYHKNGNLLSNNTNRVGDSINDQGSGQLEGYFLEVDDELLGG